MSAHNTLYSLCSQCSLHSQCDLHSRCSLRSQCSLQSVQLMQSTQLKGWFRFCTKLAEYTTIGDSNILNTVILAILGRFLQIDPQQALKVRFFLRFDVVNETTVPSGLVVITKATQWCHSWSTSRFTCALNTQKNSAGLFA